MFRLLIAAGMVWVAQVGCALEGSTPLEAISLVAAPAGSKPAAFGPGKKSPTPPSSRPPQAGQKSKPQPPPGQRVIL